MASHLISEPHTSKNFRGKQVKIIIIVLIAGLHLSSNTFGAIGSPKACSAPLLMSYSQNALDQAVLKDPVTRRHLLTNTLLKIYKICSIGDDDSELVEYFPEKIQDSVEVALAVKNRWDGRLVFAAVSEVKKLAKAYVQNSKAPRQCNPTLKTTSSVTAMYADRFHDKFIGFLQGGAKLQAVHPHLVRSSLSGAVAYVKVISNSYNRGHHQFVGETGFVSVSDTNWKTNNCL